MQYPSGPGTVANFFGAGLGGFQNGDPTTGTQGTEMDADFFNDLLGNIMHVLAAGGVNPTANRLDDLKDAIGNLTVLFHGQCQLRYLSTIALVLAPYAGTYLRINGKTYALPPAGLAIANTNVMVGGVAAQNLAASTTYLLFACDDGAGHAIPDFWPVATGHTSDTTAGNIGVEVRLNGLVPDPTRTLVGMVATDGASHFSDFLTLSWFNRRTKLNRTTFPTGVSTGSGTFVELSSTIRNTFLCWAGDVVEYRVTGTASNASTSGLATTGIGFDGTTPELESAVFSGMHTDTFGSSIVGMANLGGAKSGLAEGLHYATLLGLCAVSGSSWVGGSTPGGGTPPCLIDILVRG
jgi:hypothetical protein